MQVIYFDYNFSCKLLLGLVDHLDELWNKLFRVMDDHHEPTRICANRTARVLSKVRFV